MKLFSLIKNLKCRTKGSLHYDITGLYHKDSDVQANGLFFCLEGENFKGSSFAAVAVKNGAVAVVVEHEIMGLKGVTQIIVKNARRAMSELAAVFFENAHKHLKIVGVTGTNGKTTITNMLASVLETAGKKTAIIGTNGIYIGKNKYNLQMTTPDPIELHKYFKIMLTHGIEYVCMEVSAHAIFLDKVYGINFEACIFTNLTEDHLDYFKTMEDYFFAKQKLFNSKRVKLSIINADDEYGKKLLTSIITPKITYSINEASSFKAVDILRQGARQTFCVGNEGYQINMAGSFNVSNATATIAALKSLGIEGVDIQQGLKNLQSVEGRFNTYDVNGVLVIIDYAHTPDGLKNVLEACREIIEKSAKSIQNHTNTDILHQKMQKNSKLIAVFGCGGNRDNKKRKVMGSISETLADFTIITSDNPRFESREKIANDIEEGMQKNNHMIELDRAAAIKLALSMAEQDDVVLIAGKGAEDYIDENGIKTPYSDYAEIEKYINKN